MVNEFLNTYDFVAKDPKFNDNVSKMDSVCAIRIDCLKF